MKNNICAVYTDHFPRKVDFQLLLVKLVTLQQQKVRIRLHRGNRFKLQKILIHSFIRLDWFGPSIHTIQSIS